MCIHQTVNSLQLRTVLEGSRHSSFSELVARRILIFNSITATGSRRMRWAGHVARMGEERGVYRVLVGKPEGKRPMKDLSVDGWIILGRISRRWDVGIWTGLGWPRIETGGGRL